MRPYGDELLARMRESLTDVVIPSVADDWPRYVARAMEALLEHLELRWKHELTFLAEDTVDIRELFDGMHKALTAGDPLAGHEVVQGVVADIESLLAEPARASAAVALQAIAEENEAYRTVFEHALVSFDAIDDEAVTAELGDVRSHVRQLLQRQLERDVTLARPTFMHFGAPARTTPPDEER